MYSIKDVNRLQTDNEFFKKENEKYCLVSLKGKTLTLKDVENQCNFCILTILTHYKRGFIDAHKANFLINELEVFEYSADLLGTERVIEKINSEIISQELNTPFFNQLCVLCDDLYDFD